jgi:starch synthase
VFCCPAIRKVMAALGKTRKVMTDDTLFGGPGRVLSGRAAGIDLLVLEADHLFGRDGTPYLGPDGEDWDDNPERFAALSWIAARIADEGVTNGKGTAGGPIFCMAMTGRRASRPIT